MRTQQEMLDLILGVANNDPRIRAVILNGSRANANAPKDVYQDYDIVYVVRDIEHFTAGGSWLDVFGTRLLLQMPEAMRSPTGDGRFCWLMLFTDGNRLDLTLLPLEQPELIDKDSLSIPLLDKDGILPPFAPASDSDYRVTPPSALYYHSCCNNFWWCVQNVAKGIARDEIPYAMMMYHTIVREELHYMTSWYIGTLTGFAVSAGKMGKYFKRYLPPAYYAQYLATYSGSDPAELWAALTACCDLFAALAKAVGSHLHYGYHNAEEEGMRTYLSNVQNKVYET